MENKILEIKNLYGGYGKKDIIKDVSFSLNQGDILSVIGPNASGKTTLFRLILGNLESTKGEIIIDEKNIKELSQKDKAKLIAYIPQQHTPIFAFTVLDIVIMGRAAHFSAFDKPKKIDSDEAFKALEKVGISNLAFEKYTSLSGGQRQLVLIARAICQCAEIFIMDEPSSSLDYKNHQILLDVIKSLSEKNYTIILSTHSPEFSSILNSKVLLMKNGEIVGFGKADEIITAENLEKTYNIEMDVISVTDRYNVKRTISLPVKKGK